MFETDAGLLRYALQALSQEMPVVQIRGDDGEIHGNGDGVGKWESADAECGHLGANQVDIGEDG